jgi:hypothetical protein
MDAEAVEKYIADSFAGVDVAEAFGYTFFFYDPGCRLPEDRRFPFATLAVADYDYDRISNLSRLGVFRLNIGVKKETYRAMFGPPPSAAGDSGIVETGHDFTALDQFLPHPHYAPQSWICILNPSDARFDKEVKPLLKEAYDQAVRKYAKL